MQSSRGQSRCIMGDVQMANIDNYKIKTLMTECSRKKGPGVVNQLPQQPFSISKHKAFYSFGGNY